MELAALGPGPLERGAAGTTVTAVNQANGATYRTTTLDDGSYVLPGLAAGTYELRVAGPGGTRR